MTIIPDAPQTTLIPFPIAPTTGLPDLPVINITDPILNDPTNPLRGFVYSKYASAINDVVNGEFDRLLTWEGDDEFFDNFTNEVIDEISKKLLVAQNLRLSDAGARGFILAPSHVKNSVVEDEISAREAMLDASLSSHTQESKWAKQFMEFALPEGSDQSKLAVDENKNLVYANIAVVSEIAKSLVELQSKQAEVYSSKSALYSDSLKALDANLINQKSLIINYDAGIEGAKSAILDKSIILDKNHAENVGVILQNSESLLYAKECLNEAEIEKLKVLETHTILNGFLAEIERSNSKLVSDRASIERIKSDLNRYVKEGQISEKLSQVVSEETDAARQKLNQLYSIQMTNLKIAKTQINAFEELLGEDRIETEVASENYRQDLQTILVNGQVADFSVLGANNTELAEYTNFRNSDYIEDKSYSNASSRGEQAKLSGEYAGDTHTVRGQADYALKQAQTSANTTITLYQNIK